MDSKKYIVKSGRKLENPDLTVETWGNIGIHDPEVGLVYLAPSAMEYSTTVEDDVAVCRLDGTIMEGHRKPTVETGLHLAVYRSRGEVNTVIHTHPMYSMVYATQGEDIPLIVDETAQAMGDICRCTQYVPSGSKKLATECGKVLGKEVNSCPLHSHGTACVGEGMDAVFKVATVLEAIARILYMIEATDEKSAGISPGNVVVIRDFAKNYYGQGKWRVIKGEWEHKGIRNVKELES